MEAEQRPKTCKLRGKRYRINWRYDPKRWASCSYWLQELTFHPTFRDFGLLELLIHEGIHVCFPDLKEDAVEQSSTDIAKLVWAHRHLIFDPEEEA